MLDKNKSLNSTFTDETSYTIVSLVGDLNMFSAPELRTQLVTKLDSGVHRFILELSGLTFVDSSGIGTLVSFVSLCKKQAGSKVILCGLNQQIHNIFEVTRLLSVFIVNENLDEAKADITG